MFYTPEIVLPIQCKTIAKIPLKTTIGSCGIFEFFLQRAFPAICDRGPFSILNGKLVVKTKRVKIRGIRFTNKAGQRNKIALRC